MSNLLEIYYVPVNTGTMKDDEVFALPGITAVAAECSVCSGFRGLLFSNKCVTAHLPYINK